MAKITFEFNIPEENDMVDLIHRAEEMYLALDEIYNATRNELKHGNEELSKHVDALLERIKDRAAFINEMES